ncbi:MAG: hypothetical protein KAQ74_06745 [Dehalococcoidia bacterium]|nr:hypothetical protein [Dehalococcoidia bacterium]
MGRRISYGWVVVVAGFVITLVGYAVRNTFTVFYPAIVRVDRGRTESSLCTDYRPSLDRPLGTEDKHVSTLPGDYVLQHGNRPAVSWANGLAARCTMQVATTRVH